MPPMSALHHSLHWQFNPTLYSSQCPRGPDRKKKKTYSFKVTPKLSNVSYHLCWGKKKVGTAPGPQFIRLSKYNCAAGPRSSTPFINSNVSVSGTTPHSSHHCADPMGLLLQDKWMDPPPPFRTCGCLAHINCNSFALDVMFFTGVRPLTSFASSGEGRVILPPSSLPFRLGVVYWRGKRSWNTNKDQIYTSRVEVNVIHAFLFFV